MTPPLQLPLGPHTRLCVWRAAMSHFLSAISDAKGWIEHTHPHAVRVEGAPSLAQAAGLARLATVGAARALLVGVYVIYVNKVEMPD